MTRRTNPIITLELRTRARSGRLGLLLFGVTGLLAAFIEIAYLPVSTRSASEPEAGAGFGASVFAILVIGLAVLLCLVLPASTAGAIAGERERQTLEPLQLTRLTPWRIVRGKLAANLAVTGLLLVVQLPLLSVSYLFGGVTVAQILRAIAGLGVLAVLLTCVALAASAWAKRTQRASTAALAVVALLVLGPIAGGRAIVAVRRATASDDVEVPNHSAAELFAVSLDPILGVAEFAMHPLHAPRTDEDVYSSFGGSETVSDPFTPIDFGDDEGSALDDLSRVVAARYGPAYQLHPIPHRDFNPGTADRGRDPLLVGRAWMWSLGWSALLSVAALLVACRRLRLPTR